MLIAILGTLATVKWYQSAYRSPELISSTPTDIDALHELQSRVELVVSRVTAAVVAVEDFHPDDSASPPTKPRTFQPYCSGVIITADGLVLSQFHVSHRYPWDGKSPVRSRLPGEHTHVMLSDGRKLEAELLGADQTFDLSLLRLLAPGPHPYVPLDRWATVKLGDWVLKLGHPVGYRADRPAVVRLGRVLYQQKDMFVTDCNRTGGDSGGPFFDLDGHLIGIILSNSAPAKLRDAFVNDRDRIGPMSALNGRLISQHLNRMLRREIVAFDEADWQSFQMSYYTAQDILPRPQWTQGGKPAQPCRDICKRTAGSVVAILDESDQQVALGTVVDADGWIVTLASLLPPRPRCRTSAEHLVDAKLVGTNSAFDVALLKIAETDLPVVKWADTPLTTAGAIVVAVAPSEKPLGIGIVSVPTRNLPGPFTPRVFYYADRPSLWGKPTEKGFLVETAVGRIADAGVQAGDLLISVVGTPIKEDEDLFKCVEGRCAGETVQVQISRDGEAQWLNATLEGKLRSHADYPRLFEHDMPLSLSQCGGPVVDLDGNALGITMYPGYYGCMAIPADAIRQVLSELKTESR